MKIFFFLFLITLYKISTQIITFPFKKVYKEKKLTSENIMKELLYNNLQINLEIGTPSQIYPFLIKLQQPPTFILSEEYFDNSIKKYDKFKSSSFKDGNEKVSPYNNYHCINSTYVKDTFILGNEKIKIDFFNFILSNNINVQSKILSGEIGLKFYYPLNEKSNFLEQLINNKLIKFPIFTLEYFDNKKEGNLIFGDYPHNYKSNYFKEKDFIYSNIGLPNQQIQWHIFIDYVYSNNLIIENNTEVKLFYEYGFIEGSKDFYFNVYKKFFDEYIERKVCFEVQLYDKLSQFYIECSKEINITKFPIINFQFGNNTLKYNFTFDYNDLFMKFNGKYYFLIVFKNFKYKWIFGEPFFRKYQVTFDKDKKIFGFYSKKQYNFNFTSTLIIIILIIFLFITISLLIYFIRISLKKRKKRANELEEQFDIYF